MDTTKSKTILVAVDIEYKDAFKKLFRNAQWDRYYRKWEIKDTKRNQEKLVEFNSMLVHLQQQKEEADLIAEIRQAEKAIEEFKKLKSESEARTSKIKELKRELSERSEELDEAKKAKNEAIAKERAEELEIIEFLNNTLNMQAIVQKVNEIKAVWNKNYLKTSVQNNTIKQLQNEIVELYKPLKDLGYYLPLLSTFCVVNVYKKERHDVNSYNIADLYKIEKL